MKLKSIMTTFIVFLSMASIATAEIPQVINYQGNLTESDGTPANGAFLIKFIIYDAATGGIQLWNSGYQIVNVTNGLFEVQLGSAPMPPLPDNLFSVDTTLYLGITVGADPEISPRIRFTSVGCAYQSLRADTAGIALSVAANTVGTSQIINGSVNGSKLSGNCVTNANIVNNTILFKTLVKTAPRPVR